MKLSFVIPIYNVAPYLDRCIHSLINQDFQNFEIILVDDGSTDKCPEICDGYVSTFCNIYVIHQKNAGLSAARNAGVLNAKGEYICFVDSDDYWQPNVLGGLMAQIERDNLDVLRFKYQNVDENGQVFCPYKNDPFACDNYSSLPTGGQQFLDERFGTACYAVMFIFRKKLFENCQFTPNIYFEDTDWTPRMLLSAERVASTDTVVYNYLVREGSITKAIDPMKQKKVLDDKVRLLSALQKMQTNTSSLWFEKMICATVLSIVGILATSAYDVRKGYLQQLQQYNLFPLVNVNKNASVRLKTWLVNLSPRLAVELLHCRNKFHKK